MFKRKVVKFEIPDDARELTEEEMLLVNGGGAMTEADQMKMAQAGAENDTKTQEEIRAKYETPTPPSTTGTTPAASGTANTTPTSTTPPASVPTTPPANGSEEPNNTTPPGSSGNGGSGSSGGGSGSGGSSGSGSGSGSGGNSSPSSTNSTTTSQYKPSVSEQERYLKAGLSHVENYKKAAREALGIKGTSVSGNSFKGKEIKGWRNNGDGTHTVTAEGATLWDLYGPNWRELSGYEGDPTKLHVGDTVGKKIKVEQITGKKTDFFKIGFNPNEPNSDKRYNARDNDGEHLMTVFFSDRNNFEDFANYYLTVGQYGAANTPVYDGIGLTDNKGNIVKVLKTKEEVLAHAEMLNPTYKHNIYSPFKGPRHNTEYIQNNQLKNERDVYFETETSRYGWTVATGIGKVSSKTLLNGPAATMSFTFVNAEIAWMASPEHSKKGFSFELVDFGCEFGYQFPDSRFTIGDEHIKSGVSFSLQYERKGNDYYIDIGPFKGLSFTLEGK